MSDQEDIARLQAEWQTKHQEWRELHNLYFPAGLLPADLAQQVANAEALEAIDSAKRSEEEAYRRYMDAVRVAAAPPD
jgi:hypothetical protein